MAGTETPEERPRRADEPFGWRGEPEPDWVDAIQQARRKRAARLAEVFSNERPPPQRGRPEREEPPA